MKTLLVSVALLAICSAAPEDYHETLDDKFNFTKISSQEIRNGALCLIDDGPCSELMASYKHRLKSEWPQDFQKFLNKYDPQRRGWDRFYQTLKGARA